MFKVILDLKITGLSQKSEVRSQKWVWPKFTRPLIPWVQPNLFMNSFHFREG